MSYLFLDIIVYFYFYFYFYIWEDLHVFIDYLFKFVAPNLVSNE